MINKFEKVCKLFEQATILQIAHFLNHVTPDPGCDLPSRGVQKRAPFGPRLQNDPFWSHVTPYPGGDLPSRGVPKRDPQKSSLLGVPVFGPVLPRSSCNLPQNMVPGPKSTFWTHVTPYPGGVLPSEGGPISTFFYLGSLFGHLRMVKHHLDLALHGPKSGPNPKGASDGRDGHEKMWFSWVRL